MKRQYMMPVSETTLTALRDFDTGAKAALAKLLAGRATGKDQRAFYSFKSDNDLSAHPEQAFACGGSFVVV